MIIAFIDVYFKASLMIGGGCLLVIFAQKNYFKLTTIILLFNTINFTKLEIPCQILRDFLRNQNILNAL